MRERVVGRGQLSHKCQLSSSNTPCVCVFLPPALNIVIIRACGSVSVIVSVSASVSVGVIVSVSMRVSVGVIVSLSMRVRD